MTIVITPIVSDEQWHSLRAKCVGASEAGALVGEHEYLSYWGLWARKSGKLPAVEDNGAMERGRRLEPVAVEMIRDRFPTWTITTVREHYADHEFGIGATPDLLAFDPDRGDGIIQIKSVAPSAFRTAWRQDDELRVPTWIAIQAIMEAHLTKSTWAQVAALVVDYEIHLHLIDIPLHAGIVEAIKSEAVTFWERVIRGQEPEPDYRRDHALIRAALGSDDGSEIDLSQDNELPDLLDRRETAARIIKEANEERDEITGRLLHKLGHAARGRFNGGTITAKMVSRAAYQVPPSTFRKLTVKRDHGSDHDRGHGRN